jgi:CO dehydrogenase maturation factor
MDNEAGMEHISRLTTNDIDLLLVVSDPTRRGIQAAGRIVELTNSLGLNIGRRHLIINQSRTGQNEAITQAVEEYGLDLIGMVPDDSEVRDFDLNGKPTVELVNENRAVKAAYEIFEKIFET